MSILFLDIVWDQVRIDPPFCPDLDNDVDTSYFDSRNLLDLSALLADDEVIDMEEEGIREEQKSEQQNMKAVGDTDKAALTTMMKTSGVRIFPFSPSLMKVACP